ncbi:protein trichome birefringence-like 34 [Rutidosis leptorrhynchoides]|uniref:protein trichome birefringence-like 34 n=1 Tax=Rutidosis leptorrhynchoides TaxID=125765 RepID=UPI003A99C42D
MGKRQCSILWDMKSMFHFSIVMVFFGGVATLNFYRNNNHQVASSNIKVITFTNKTSYASANASIVTNIENGTQVLDHKRLKIRAPPSITKTSCDLFVGRWIHDNKSHYPLYKEEECPYLHGDLACLTYGRRDSKYQQWRWQPHGCDFPRFDGKAIIEKLKGKRLLFVGDSVNRNQWDSMLCMLHSFIPGKKKVNMGALNHTLYTFRAQEYNISIDYYWAPMLVESNGDDPSNHRLDHRTIRIENIEKHARHWVNADILVFNTYLWWRLPIIKFLKSPGSCLGDPDQVYDKVKNVEAYKIVLETWSKWVHAHINPAKTRMFFMGLTATHSMAAHWGGKKEASCYEEKEPVLDDGFWDRGTDPKMLRILVSTLAKLKLKGVNVQLINITQLTQYRKDAHPTVYRKLWRPLSKEQKKNPYRASDCTHWCLPGVPDIWNELLFAYIFRA